MPNSIECVKDIDGQAKLSFGLNIYCCCCRSVVYVFTRAVVERTTAGDRHKQRICHQIHFFPWSRVFIKSSHRGYLTGFFGCFITCQDGSGKVN